MMRRWSAEAVIRAWELGLGQPAMNQALAILAVACPEMSWDALAALSIGRRDALLFAVRQQLFGSRLAGFVECPACQARLEFTLDAPDTQTPPSAATAEEARHVTVGDCQVTLRWPNSLDLVAVAACQDAATARDLLIRRCVVAAQAREAVVPADRLPEAVVAALAATLAEQHSQAEVELKLACPTCGHTWETWLDIASFVWTEISAQARRLLREVGILARAYGWREADILALSAVRRQVYLEMVV